MAESIAWEREIAESGGIGPAHPNHPDHAKFYDKAGNIMVTSEDLQKANNVVGPSEVQQ
jgi:hypothetical protein